MRKRIFMIASLAVLGLTFVFLVARGVSLFDCGRTRASDSIPGEQIMLASGPETASELRFVHR